jgi:hypothetical protein
VALIDGTPGAVWAPGGRPRAVFAFRVIGNAISEIEIVTECRIGLGTGAGDCQCGLASYGLQ